jgi:hypothetical protein
VIENIVQCSKVRPQLVDDIVVFDNASTRPQTVERLLRIFPRVHVSDRNIGYWSALDWVVRNVDRALPGPACDLMYVIESDMIHYDIQRLADAERFLRMNPQVGSVRCMEYSIKDQRLYDKSRPVPGGRRWAWQNHTHLVTNERIKHTLTDVPGIYTTNFLAQLPALNRVSAISRAFVTLRARGSFTEHDFQRACYEQHPVNALIDGGIFHVKLTASDGSSCLSGSWSTAQQLSTVGYRETRRDAILPSDSYSVNVVERRS